MAAVAGTAGVLLAVHHPLWPGPALVLFGAWCIVVHRWPASWLVVLPAVLPAMNIAPWTGWIAFDELDLVVLGAVAGGTWSLAADTTLPAGDGAWPRVPRVALLGGALATLAFVHGIVAAVATSSPGWYDGELDPLNAWRVFKPVAYAALLWPLLAREMACDARLAVERLARGMVAGLALVAVACAWERAAGPGLLTVDAPYRTVALFWEMHVGGAALDAWFALAMPFVAWAAACAHTPARWSAAALLAGLALYACMTSYSRGAQVASAAGIVVYAVLSGPADHGAWPARRRFANRCLLAALVVEAVGIAVASGIMTGRWQDTAHDFGTRLAHWRAGLGVLHAPIDAWTGLGLGRLPAALAGSAPGHAVPGSARVHDGPGGIHVLRLRGPDGPATLRGLYALTQRVAPTAQDASRVVARVRTQAPAHLLLRVCERHLLYDLACCGAVVPAGASGGGWETVSARLDASPWRTGNPLHASVVFAIAALEPGATIDVTSIRLVDDTGADILRNGDFSAGLAHWFPVAQAYFLPWHIDSLPLELVLEQGLIGLTAFALLVAAAYRRLLMPRIRGLPLTPVVVGSLTGTLLLGLVSSVLDVARIALLFYLLVLMSLQIDPPASGAPETR